jgi:hypothetical protein
MQSPADYHRQLGNEVYKKFSTSTVPSILFRQMNQAINHYNNSLRILGNLKANFGTSKTYHYAMRKYS